MIFLAVYLSSRFDFHKQTQIKSNDFSYIKKYYHSINKLKLKSKIFVDTTSRKFIIKYQNDNIKFIFDPISITNKSIDKIENKILIHDLRFIMFRKFLLHEKYSHYFLSDISDVEILNNPLNLDDKYLYVGQENENILDNIWFQYYIKDMDFIDKYFPDYLDVFDHKIILNCGTIFGNYLNIKKLLDYLQYYLIIIYSNENITRPLDMFLVNYICYKYLYEIVSSENFNTVFGRQEYDYNKIVKHK